MKPATGENYSLLNHIVEQYNLTEMLFINLV